MQRFYTQEGKDIFDAVPLCARQGEDGTEFTVPEDWGQAATDVLLAKVFYPEPLPALLRPVPEEGVPLWLWRQEVDEAGLDDVSAEFRFAHETDIRDVLRRICGFWTYRAWKAGLLDTEKDASAFYDETRHILLHRIASPEIAQWAAIGLDWAYGLAHAKKYIPAQRIIALGSAGENPASAGVVIDAMDEGKNIFKRVKLMAQVLALNDMGEKCAVLMPAEHADSLPFMAWKMQAEEDRRALAEGRKAQGLFQPEEENRDEDRVAAVLSVSDAFMETTLTGHGWKLFEEGREVRHADGARLMETLVDSIHATGEPHIFFRDKSKNGRGRSRTGGFIAAPGSAASSAVIDIAKCHAPEDITQAALLLTMALTDKTNPAAISLTGMAAFLMERGLAYDSDEGLKTAARVASLATKAALDTARELKLPPSQTMCDTELPVQFLLGAETRDIAPLGGIVRFEAAQLFPSGKRLHPSVAKALDRLGYSPAQTEDIALFATGRCTLKGAPHINHESLKKKGFHQAALSALEAALLSAQHIRYAFNKWTLSEDFCEHMLGFTAEEMDAPDFDMLEKLGFTVREICEANAFCCGAMALRGAPHLTAEHVAVFDAPSPEAQVRMQGAIEKSLTGAVVHTVEIPHAATTGDVQKLILKGWELGVKSLKIYRDRCLDLVAGERNVSEEEILPAPRETVRLVS